MHGAEIGRSLSTGTCLFVQFPVSVGFWCLPFLSPFLHLFGLNEIIIGYRSLHMGSWSLPLFPNLKAKHKSQQHSNRMLSTHLLVCSSKLGVRNSGIWSWSHTALASEQLAKNLDDVSERLTMVSSLNDKRFNHHQKDHPRLRTYYKLQQDKLFPNYIERNGIVLRRNFRLHFAVSFPLCLLHNCVLCVCVKWAICRFCLLFVLLYCEGKPKRKLPHK